MASRSTLRNTDPKKVSGELFALTYGGLVSTLLRDYENVDDVNKQVKISLLIAIQFFISYFFYLISAGKNGLQHWRAFS